jgi:hypothetical protein
VPEEVWQTFGRAHARRIFSRSTFPEEIVHQCKHELSRFLILIFVIPSLIHLFALLFDTRISNTGAAPYTYTNSTRAFGFHTFDTTAHFDKIMLSLISIARSFLSICLLEIHCAPLIASETCDVSFPLSPGHQALVSYILRIAWFVVFGEILPGPDVCKWTCSNPLIAMFLAILSVSLVLLLVYWAIYCIYHVVTTLVHWVYVTMWLWLGISLTIMVVAFAFNDPGTFGKYLMEALERCTRMLLG